MERNHGCAADQSVSNSTLKQISQSAAGMTQEPQTQKLYLVIDGVIYHNIICVHDHNLHVNMNWIYNVMCRETAIIHDHTLAQLTHISHTLMHTQVINNVGTVASVPAFAVSSPKIRSSLQMSASDSALKMVRLSII